VILVDTSAWIEFTRGTGSAVHRRLAGAIAEDEPLATTGIVLLELLAGARDETQAEALRRLLARCRFLPLQEPNDHEVAAALFRGLRQRGLTIRALPDSLIAAVALRNRAALLHADRDFDAIASVAPLRVLTA
jgi:predicted nucleic acid-binding protein